MDTGEDEILFERRLENSLMLNTIEILDDEKQSILTEILKCVVCLEIPVGKQVKICEKGHHFCYTCHENMRACGVCRGPLLSSRNFVVEELVMKLGPILGTSGYKLPRPRVPYSIGQGFFQCLHQCLTKVPAFLMLPHLKDCHSSNLIHDIRSNPYSGRFSFTFSIQFLPNETFTLSVQVSDMGLFTIQITFFEYDLFGCVRMLIGKTIVPPFRYQLVVSIPNKNSESLTEFSITNCTVSSYSDDSVSLRKEGKGLKIKGQNLLEHLEIKSQMNVFFSVWNVNFIKCNQQSTPSVVCMPEKCKFFKSDRKIRRNKSRNLRRKRTKEAFRNAKDTRIIPEEFLG